jgi:hypothetical protein
MSEDAHACVVRRIGSAPIVREFVFGESLRQAA